MSHLSAQQGLLLALARVDHDRACRRVAAKRGRDSEEDGHDVSVAGRSEVALVASAVDAANATSVDVGHGPTSLLATANNLAPTAGASRVRTRP
jgi:hypothetical protein